MMGIPICTVICLMATAIIVWKIRNETFQIIGSAIFGTASVFLIATLMFIPIERVGNIKEYKNLSNQREVLVAAMKTDVDLTILAEEILDYNAEVTRIKNAASGFFLSIYYSAKVDWESLELLKIREDEK